MIVGAGATVSTVKVTAPLVPEWPAASVCVAVTVYVPSASDAGVADQVAAERVGVSVWIGEPLAAPPL